MKRFPIIGLAVSLTLMTGNVSAQDTEGLEEIVVTATKREQTLQDVPVAVTVTTAEVLERAQIRNVSDLQSVVPSLRVSTNQTSIQTTFIIRGFGNGANNPGIEPAVGVFIDGVYRSRSAGAIGDLIDVQRVEVLRGPQSTLFGQNTTAGVINVVTQKPSTDGVKGFLEASVGNFNEWVFRGKLTGPLSDTVAGSITASVNNRDGYFRVFPSTELPSGSFINDRDRQDIRGQLLWQPSDNVEVRVIGDTSRINELCCGVVNVLNGATGAVINAVGGQIVANSPFSRSNYLNRLPINEVNNSGFSAQIDWNLENFALTSITALRKQDYDFTYDFDFTSASLGGTNRNISDTSTLTQELRLSFDDGGRFRGLLGAYALDEDVDFQNQILFGAAARNYATVLAASLSGQTTAQIAATFSGLETRPAVPAALFGLPAGTPNLSAGPGAGRYFANNSGNNISNKQENQAYTIFAQGEFDLTDKWTVTAGLARTNSKKDIKYADDAGEAFAAENLVTIGFYQLLGAFQPVNPFTGTTGALFGLRQALGLTTAQMASLADRASVADGRRIPCVPITNPLTGATLACLTNSALGLVPLQFLAPVTGFTDGSDDSKTTFTAKLSYEINDRASVYGSVATGFKATSWNLSRDSKPVEVTPARSPLGGALNPWYPRYGSRNASPEEAISYELGFKAQGDRASLNIAIFDQDIEDFQENTFRGTGFVLSNAGKQNARGIEIESRFRIGTGWTAELAGTILKPKYESYPGAPNACTSGITTSDRSGTRPFGIHGQSLSAAFTYAWQRGETDGFARVDYQRESNTLISTLETSASNCNVSPPTNTFDSYREVNSVNASAGFTRNDWTVMIWGRNLNNDDYLTATFPGVAQAGTVSGYPNEPRTYGLTIRKNFGGN